MWACGREGTHTPNTKHYIFRSEPSLTRPASAPAAGTRRSRSPPAARPHCCSSIPPTPSPARIPACPPCGCCSSVVYSSRRLMLHASCSHILHQLPPESRTFSPSLSTEQRFLHSREAGVHRKKGDGQGACARVRDARARDKHGFAEMGLVYGPGTCWGWASSSRRPQAPDNATDRSARRRTAVIRPGSEERHKERTMGGTLGKGSTPVPVYDVLGASVFVFVFERVEIDRTMRHTQHTSVST